MIIWQQRCQKLLQDRAVDILGCHPIVSYFCIILNIHFQELSLQKIIMVIYYTCNQRYMLFYLLQECKIGVKNKLRSCLDIF